LASWLDRVGLDLWPDAAEVQPFIGVSHCDYEFCAPMNSHRLLVDISAMSDGYKRNQKNSVVNGVENAVVANSKSKTIASS